MPNWFMTQIPLYCCRLSNKQLLLSNIAIVLMLHTAVGNSLAYSTFYYDYVYIYYIKKNVLFQTMYQCRHDVYTHFSFVCLFFVSFCNLTIKLMCVLKLCAQFVGLCTRQELGQTVPQLSN